MELEEIAYIKTDFKEKFGIPRQSGLVEELCGKIIFTPKYRNPDAIRGIEAYSHLWLLWGFSENEREGYAVTVAPPRLGGRKRLGVFATRAPFRPNPIGLSSVKLEKVEFSEKYGFVLVVSGVDMLNNTPIYDIKPYLPYTDVHLNAKGGFGEELKDRCLNVIFSEEMLLKIDEKDRSAVKKILSNDPRTAFIHDSERIWGITYKHYNIRFTVKETELTVREVSFI